MKQYALDVAGLSDRGIKRDHNEDAWAAPPPGLTPEVLVSKGELYLVADGVGGHLAGDVASKMAVQTIQERYYADPSPDVPTSLSAAIQVANNQIGQEADASPERRGMSTTVTAVVLRGDELTVANLGDSRTYLIRDGQSRQITADHTWVEEQVRVGIITPEQAAKHPQRNIITRSLGSSPEPEIDLFDIQLKLGDSVMLCSDGLSNMVSDDEISTIVSQGRKSETSVIELIELAKKRGAPDNVTAVLLTIRHRKRGGCLRTLIAWTIVIVAAIVIGALVWNLII